MSAEVPATPRRLGVSGSLRDTVAKVQTGVLIKGRKPTPIGDPEPLTLQRQLRQGLRRNAAVVAGNAVVEINETLLEFTAEDRVRAAAAQMLPVHRRV